MTRNNGELLFKHRTATLRVRFNVISIEICFTDNYEAQVMFDALVDSWRRGDNIVIENRDNHE